MSVEIRVANRGDLSLLKPLVESAYRGDSARRGWTHEADLVTGERIDSAGLAALINDPASRLLIVQEGVLPLGCVNIADRGEGLAYLGLLCVDPVRQTGGLGSRLIAAAEALAVRIFGARQIEMTVIDRRRELIAYYERRGYRASGEVRPFPMPIDPPLTMTVLVKSIEPAQ